MDELPSFGTWLKARRKALEGKGLPEQASDRLFDQMSDEQLRCRPHPVMNSVAWNVLHMARAEDIALNRIVVDGIQVFDHGNWGEQMHTGRYHGSGMSDPEVTALNVQIDLAALRGYYNAVRARTAEVVNTLTPAELDELPVAADPHSRDGLAYEGWSRGEVLIHLALTHNYGHIYEVCTVCSLMSITFWQW